MKDFSLNRYIDYNESIIKRELEGSERDNEYIRKMCILVTANITNLFYRSDLSMRQFAAYMDISHSTMKRLINANTAVKVDMSTLCKIALRCDYPIECLVSTFEKDEIEFLKRYKKLSQEQKHKLRKALDRAEKMEKRDNESAEENEDTIQLSIFDILKEVKDENVKAG